MIEYILWIAIALMIGVLLIPKRYPQARPMSGGIGWIFFSMYWFSQPEHYILIDDAFNVILTFLMALFCLFIAYSLVVSNPGKKQNTLMLVTKVTVMTCVFYFPFAEIPVLNSAIISATAVVTTWTLNLIGVPAYFKPPVEIWIDQSRVEIILACTAIESMALFAGVILAVNAHINRKVKAFLITVPVIWVLNLLRTMFVVMAFSYTWFGTAEQSFYMAHHVISKILSTAALLIMAYALFVILPEALKMIESVIDMIRGGER